MGRRKEAAKTVNEAGETIFLDLEVALEEPDQVEQLKLRGETHDGIPEGVGTFENLWHLDLGRNSFAQFPGTGTLAARDRIKILRADRSCISTVTDEIGDFSAVEILDLAWNEVTDLPKSLGRLDRLEVLNLERNPLVGLPDSVEDLSALRELRVTGCELATLPRGLTSLPALEVIQASDNELRELPQELGKSPRLRVVEVARNQLEVLPESVASLASLRVLDLCDNELRTLPESLEPGSLRRLRYLSLAHNDELDLEGVSPWLASLGELRVLDLSGLTLPQQIVFPTTVQELIWRYGDGPTIPASIGSLGGLRELDLAFGGLEAFPFDAPDLGGLESLDLTSNRVEELAGTIGSLKNLRRLVVAANGLTALPQEIGELQDLRALDLGHNQLRSLPTGFADLTNLEELNLEGNHLADLDALVEVLRGAKNLRRVRLIGNPVTLTAGAKSRLTALHPLCTWELDPGAALHDQYRRARSKLAAGAVEQARVLLEGVANFDGSEAEMEQSEEYTVFRVRQDAQTILSALQEPTRGA